MSKEVNIKQKGIRMTNSGLKVPGIKAAISPNSDLPHLTFSIGQNPGQYINSINFTYQF